MKTLGLLGLALTLFACGPAETVGPPPAETPPPASSSFPVQVAPRYAELFAVSYQGPYVIVEIWAPWQLEGQGLRYRLRRRGTAAPAAEEGVREVEVPLRRVATTSTTELPAFTLLGVAETWVGHSELDFVSSSRLRARIDAGLVREIGAPADRENLLILRADALFADFLTRPELDRLALVDQAGTTLLVVPGFLEKAPLGRAEWILLFSLFFGREREALAHFAEVERRYLALQERVDRESRYRPRVFTGGPYQNVWHVPGGRSFVARLLHDAGAAYLWPDDPSTGALALDLEAVFERAQDADYWLYPSHWRSLREIAAVDPRLAAFDAWKGGRVIAADLRLSPLGGNDFWEEGAARPDLVLEDLVAFFHPELLPGHALHFHRLLQESAPP